MLVPRAGKTSCFNAARHHALPRQTYSVAARIICHARQTFQPCTKGQYPQTNFLSRVAEALTAQSTNHQVDQQNYRVWGGSVEQTSCGSNTCKSRQGVHIFKVQSNQSLKHHTRLVHTRTLTACIIFCICHRPNSQHCLLILCPPHHCLINGIASQSYRRPDSQCWLLISYPLWAAPIGVTRCSAFHLVCSSCSRFVIVMCLLRTSYVRLKD